jgi:hypothetical protein
MPADSVATEKSSGAGKPGEAKDKKIRPEKKRSKRSKEKMLLIKNTALIKESAASRLPEIR